MRSGISRFWPYSSCRAEATLEHLFPKVFAIKISRYTVKLNLEIPNSVGMATIRQTSSVSRSVDGYRTNLTTSTQTSGVSLYLIFRVPSRTALWCITTFIQRPYCPGVRSMMTTKVVVQAILSKLRARNETIQSHQINDSGKNWTIITDLDTLSKATAILGYCENVVIQLGTERRLKQYPHFRHALADIEDPAPEGFLGTMSAAMGILGWITMGLAFSFRAQRELKDARERKLKRMYSSVLELAEKQAFIVFDTGNGQQRAWMVPQFSVILDLYNYWAYKKGRKDIKFIEPKLPQNATAKKILSNEQYHSIQVILKKHQSDPSDLDIGDMIKYIYGQMMSRSLKDLENDAGAEGTFQIGCGGIIGWDLLELTFDEAPDVKLERREIKISNGTLTCWMPFTKKLPVFLGQNLGQLITPAPKPVCKIQNCAQRNLRFCQKEREGC